LPQNETGKGLPEGTKPGRYAGRFAALVCFFIGSVECVQTPEFRAETPPGKRVRRSASMALHGASSRSKSVRESEPDLLNSMVRRDWKM
jgi:hypothetical protein